MIYCKFLSFKKNIFFGSAKLPRFCNICVHVLIFTKKPTYYKVSKKYNDDFYLGPERCEICIDIYKKVIAENMSDISKMRQITFSALYTLTQCKLRCGIHFRAKLLYNEHQNLG